MFRWKRRDPVRYFFVSRTVAENTTCSGNYNISAQSFWQKLHEAPTRSRPSTDHETWLKNWHWLKGNACCFLGIPGSACRPACRPRPTLCRLCFCFCRRRYHPRRWWYHPWQKVRHVYGHPPKKLERKCDMRHHIS